MLRYYENVSLDWSYVRIVVRHRGQRSIVVYTGEGWERRRVSPKYGLPDEFKEIPKLRCLLLVGSLPE